jgi:branched-chain amino acid transport system permease protein
MRQDEAAAIRSAQRRGVQARRLLAGAGVLACALAPLLADGFTLFQITLALILAIAILGLTLLTGVAGQISLGQGAFYALGAYTAAILTTHAGVAYGWTLPAAGALCFLAGLLFGLPALRLEGTYLALATFALALSTPQLLKLSALEPWTGGVQGLVLDKPEPPFGLPLTADQWLYALALAVAAPLYAAAHGLVRSRTGRALMAVRDDPIAARAAGVNVSLYKALAMGVGALYAGVAGALGAITVQYVAPDSFTFTLSIALFVGLVVGGVGFLPGALFGGLFVQFAPNLAEAVSKGLTGAVYGVFLLLVVFAMPSGLGGLLRAASARWPPPHRRAPHRRPP